MKKIDLKALALSCLAMGLLFGNASVFAEDKNDETSFLSYDSSDDDEDDYMILAGGSCGGGGCHGKTPPPPPSTNGTTDAVNPNVPQNPVPSNGGSSCRNVVSNAGHGIDASRRANLI